MDSCGTADPLILAADCPSIGQVVQWDEMLCGKPFITYEGVVKAVNAKGDTAFVLQTWPPTGYTSPRLRDKYTHVPLHLLRLKPEEEA